MVQRVMISVSVCLFVCLFVCLSARMSQKSKATYTNISTFSVRVTCGRAATVLCDMLCTSGFVDDVIFPYNRGNRPESKTTRMFRPVRQVAAPVRRQRTLFGRYHQAAASGMMSAVSRCILFASEASCN